MDRVRSALEGAIETDRGDSMTACCPVHDDNRASMSVTWRAGDAANGGLVLLHCHGCSASASEIAEAVGLGLVDLYDDPPKISAVPASQRVGRSKQARTSGKRRSKSGRLPRRLFAPEPAPSEGWKVTRRYDYVDASGTAVQQVIRREVYDENGKRHKKFVQRFRDPANPSGTWLSSKPGGFTPVLFRHPEVLAAIASGTTVWLLEGEKDVETAEQLGLVATTNAQGAGSFPPELTSVFEGADVRVVLDRDQGGAARGLDLSASLMEAGAHRVQLLYPAVTTEKADFTDHVEAGFFDDTSDTGGLVAVSVSDVRLDEARYKALAAASQVTAACREANGRLEASRADRIGAAAATEEHDRARRWATEAERRYEIARDLADQVRDLVVADGRDEATHRFDEVDDIVGMAMREAIAVHEVLGMPVPPVLQPRDEQVPASTVGVEDPVADVGDVGGEVTSLVQSPADRSSGGLDEGVMIQRPTYQIQQGALVEVVIKDGKPPQVKEILSLDAHLVAIEVEELLDDTMDTAVLELLDSDTRDTMEQMATSGVPTVLSFLIRYTDPASGEAMEVSIPARDYRDCAWLESLPGPPRFDSRPAGRAKVLDAMKAAGRTLTGGVPHVVRHRATGWRRDSEGQWYYVHAAGAIDSSGYRSAPVNFGGALRNYMLPRPTTDAQLLREAFRDWSAALFDVLPDRVVAPVLGQAFRAALGPTQPVVTMVGLPGSYKTAIASLVMHHWGLGWDRSRTGASMSGAGDTANALRIKTNQAKDALFWADDVAPGEAGWSAAQGRLEAFGRLIYNGEGKARSTRDGQGLHEDTPPRTSAIVTSEVGPRPGSSGGERMLIVPVAKEDVELDEIIRMSDPQGHRARSLLMASFLQWAAGRLSPLRTQCKNEVEQFSKDLRASGVDTRTAESLGNVFAGWVCWLEWLQEVGALAGHEADAVLARVIAGLQEAWESSKDPDQPGSLAGQARELISHALSTGLAYVDDVRTGLSPEWPLASQLGWSRTEMPMADGGFRMDKGKSRLGWVSTGAQPADDDELLVDKSQLEAVLKAASATLTNGVSVDRTSALKALCDDGTLIPELRAGRTPRNTVQRSIPAVGVRRRVVALKLWRIIDAPDDPSDSGEDDLFPDSGGPQGGASPWPPVTDLLAGVCPTSDVSSAHTDDDPVASLDGEGGDISSEDDDVIDDPNQISIDEVLEVDEVLEESAPPAGTDQPESQGVDESVADSPVPSGPARASAASQVASEPTQPETTQVREAAPATTDRPQRRSTRAKAGQFTASLAVVHTDGVWLPDGTRHELPDTLEHAGHLAELVDTLQLGTMTSQASSEPGQVWVTPEALSSIFGVTPSSDQLDPTKWLSEMSAATAGSTLVEGALADGWTIGGRQTDRMSRWTRIWKGDRRGVFIVLMSLIADDPATWPTLADDPEPVVVARRMQKLADAMRFPYKVSAQTTGLDLATTCRVKDRKEAFAPSDPCPPARMANLEDDYNWVRTPTSEESKRRYVHAFDRGGSYAGAVAGLELGIGSPEQLDGDDIAFDKKLPGYWLIDREQWQDWRIPHPLNLKGDAVSASGQIWVTTPTLEFACELGLDPVIHQAFVWTRHARVLEGWYKRIRDARTALDTEDVDDIAARNQLKTIYTRLIGNFGSDVLWRGRKGYAPERRHHIVAKARANLGRRFMQIGESTGEWPLAVSKDTLLYASDEADPVKAWPGMAKSYGRGFGQFRHEKSGLMADHVEFLDPDLDPTGRHRWLGKEHLSDEVPE